MTDTPITHPLSQRLREAASNHALSIGQAWHILDIAAEAFDLQAAEIARLRAEVEALSELYDAASAGFTTMHSSGHDGVYKHVSAFPNLDALQRYGAAWTNAMTKVRGARAEGRSDG